MIYDRFLFVTPIVSLKKSRKKEETRQESRGGQKMCLSQTCVGPKKRFKRHTILHALQDSGAVNVVPKNSVKEQKHESGESFIFLCCLPFLSSLYSIAIIGKTNRFN